MKYLVTGGAGFIGSHLCDLLLSAGHDVVVLDDFSTGKRENLESNLMVIEGCITQPLDVAQAMSGVDGVFHLAAVASVTRSVEQWAQTHRINQSGAVEVFDQAATLGVPVVYASSAAAYGDNTNLPLKESAETKPLSPYGLDKLACEWQAQVGAHIKGLKSVGLRFFNVYGPRQDPKSPYSGVISIFADKLKAGQAVAVFGDGEQTRDFIYVADIVATLEASMQKLHSGEVDQLVSNACTQQSISVNQLAETLSEVGSIIAEIQHKPAREGDIKHSCGDASCMNQQLGVVAKTSLKVGLEALWKSL
ncbi:MAG: NAD-dependent epimerase/dehydratase family protein [Rickettsiales bacterium]|nr:NAD-dependent epimerase/dehydratase family protein [Rickettsiales bacterium]